MKAVASKNFKLSEFECPHCGKNKIDGALISLLQQLRDAIDTPIYVTSGYRCPVYNAKIGGYKNSAHLKGKAADIHAKNMDIITLAKKAKDIGFKRIGLYPNNYFIHVDLLKPSRFASWIRRNGVYTYYKTLEDAIINL